MRVIITVATIAAVTLSGCKAETAATPATPPATAATAPTTGPSTSPTTSAPPTPAQPPAKLIKVPAVTGLNHQTAQNTMQAAGLFDLREKDATGQGRLLIWDRNWVVVRQTPPAGRRVHPDTVVTLYSKKIGE
jgi:beta-lactam-binding protein with PASTA domain